MLCPRKCEKSKRYLPDKKYHEGMKRVSYRHGPVSSCPAISSETPKGRDCKKTQRQS
jgi:hypothetical protein